MSRGRRLSNPPGGASTHNPFSWDEGTVEARVGGAAPIGPAISNPMNGGSEAAVRSSVRLHQPAGGASQISFSAPPDAAEPDFKVRPQSAYKARELSGSGVFSPVKEAVSSNAYANGNDQNNGNYITDRPSVRMHQPAGGRSSISLGGGEDVTVPREMTAARIAKQAELGGTWDSSEESLRSSSSKKQASSSTSQVVFGDEKPMDFISRRLSGSKISELSGSNIFSSGPSDADAEYKPSDAKVKEMSGNDIFSDKDQAVPQQLRRDSVGGVRKPPGGDSTVSLV